MPWITNDQLKDAVAGAVGTGSGNLLPAHWNLIIPWANAKAYKQLRAIFTRRGYLAAVLDQWDDNAEWNERLGVLHAMLRGAKRGEQFSSDFLMRDYQQALEELKEEQIVVGGVAVGPTGPYGRIGTGELDTSEDRFLLDDAQDGDFPLGAEGTRL